MDIRNVILLLQSKKGLTQTQIAHAIGCSQASISCFARGHHGLVRPSSKVVDGLRKLLADNGLVEFDEIKN